MVMCTLNAFRNFFFSKSIKLFPSSTHFEIIFQIALFGPKFNSHWTKKFKMRSFFYKVRCHKAQLLRHHWSADLLKHIVRSRHRSNPKTNERIPAPMYPVMAADCLGSGALMRLILLELICVLSMVRLFLSCVNVLLSVSSCRCWFSGLFQYSIRLAKAITVKSTLKFHYFIMPSIFFNTNSNIREYNLGY